MNIQPYVQHIPEIEKRIRDFRLDTIVLGLGPTAWLLPWLDQSLIANLRRIGGHDASKVMHCHDLLLLDLPVFALHPETDRFKTIINSRPERFFIYHKNWVGNEQVKGWKEYWPKELTGITEIVDFDVWYPHDLGQRGAQGVVPILDGNPPPTSCVSPVGCVTTAWRRGSRRIGVIGMDMMPNHHKTFSFVPTVNWVFKHLRRRAVELGGEIVNLSPVSQIHKIQPDRCKQPPTSGSAPTSTNVPLEPSESLSTASASMPPAP